MNRSIRILHLSDLHIDGSQTDEFKLHVLQPLLKDLKTETAGKSVDLVLISGDLLNQGGSGFNNAAEAFAFIQTDVFDPILRALSLTPEHIFFTPGNHDVVRKADSLMIEVGMRQTLQDSISLAKFVSENSAITEHEGLRRMLDFKKFEVQFYQGVLEQEKRQTLFESTFIIKINGIKIGICCLNTAWRSYDSKADKGLLMVGEHQISRSLADLKDCEYRILVGHHAPEYLADFEAKEIYNAISAHLDMCFFGHNHSPDSYTKSAYNGSAFTAVSRGNMAKNRGTTDISYINGYSLFDVGFDSIIQRPKVFAKSRYEFVVDTAIAGDAGFCEFPVRRKDSGILFLQKTAKHIENTALVLFDDHLVSSGIETAAPSTLKELFVAPRLVRYAKDEEKELDTEIDVDLNHILDSKENFAIFGLKETGKTILLDKLVTTFVERTNELHQIPVPIDFQAIGNRRIETLISQFSGIPILELPKRLKEYNFVLLIDNFRFETEYSGTHYKIADFLRLHNKVRLICTSPLLVEDQIPIEFYRSDVFLNLNILFLKYFLTKQIRELTEKWHTHSQGVTSEKKAKIKDITNLLLELKLPRTPMAISMFLWILEKQEGYQPVNQAVMLENFIERMFKKHSRQEHLIIHFDFRNKERLLTEIAREMYRLNENSYGIPYSDLLKFVDNYLQSRTFPFESKRILDHFMDVGIFKEITMENETLVEFRFNCFFQYFLMKNMEQKDFYDYVMAEGNYLSFLEEIDYFTGLNRGNTETLKTIVTRMETAFHEMNQDIKSLEHGYDTFFLNDPSELKELKLNLATFKEGKNSITAEEMEIISDKRLESAGAKHEVELKQFTLSKFDRLARAWTLAARVLRNTEETSERGLKYGSFSSILQCSFSFMALYKGLVLRELKDPTSKMPANLRKNVEMIVRFLPVAHEALLYETMASAKMELIFKQHMDMIVDEVNISDVEKFVSVFLYADGHPKDAQKYLRALLKQLRNKYFLDMMLFKIVTYYYMRTEGRDLDLFYENLMADILVEARGYDKQQKSKLMADSRSKRRRTAISDD